MRKNGFSMTKTEIQAKVHSNFQNKNRSIGSSENEIANERNDTEETICNTAHRDFLLQANKDFHICINYENYLIYGLVMRKICKCQIG